MDVQRDELHRRMRNASLLVDEESKILKSNTWSWMIFHPTFINIH